MTEVIVEQVCVDYYVDSESSEKIIALEVSADLHPDYNYTYVKACAGATEGELSSWIRDTSWLPHENRQYMHSVKAGTYEMRERKGRRERERERVRSNKGEVGEKEMIRRREKGR